MLILNVSVKYSLTIAIQYLLVGTCSGGEVLRKITFLQNKVQIIFKAMQVHLHSVLKWNQWLPGRSVMWRYSVNHLHCVNLRVKFIFTYFPATGCIVKCLQPKLLNPTFKSNFAQTVPSDRDEWQLVDNRQGQGSGRIGQQKTKSRAVILVTLQKKIFESSKK